MIKHFILSIIALCILSSNNATGQSYWLIKGKVLDSISKAEIPNYSIRIENKKSLVLFYKQYFGNPEFEITLDTLQISHNEQLYLFVTSPNHYTFRTSITFENNPNLEVNFLLVPILNVLDSVKVTNSPIWTRGDTTFYRIEDFKDGTEKKLIDIVKNLPDLEITTDGNLLFKKKPIEKILIEGEDLFANKIKVLLNAFPAHVISQLQVLENQTNNKLLKGIDGQNKTIVNISLKKEMKYKIGFGDTQLRIGNNKRYEISATLFSLFKKNKIGLISQNNSMGNYWGNDIEFETKNNDFINQQIIHYKDIFRLNNFNNDNFILNRLFNQQLKYVTQLTSKSSLEAEIGVESDKINQETFYISKLLSRDSILQFQNHTTNQLNTKQLSLSLKYTYQFDNKTLLEVISTNSNNKLINKLSYTSLIGKDTGKILSTLQDVLSKDKLIIGLTRRINENKGVTISLNLEKANRPQLLYSNNNWSFILPSQTQHTFLNATNNFLAKNNEIIFSLFTKDKKNITHSYITKIVHNMRKYDPKSLIIDNNQINHINSLSTLYKAETFQISELLSKSIYFKKNKLSINTELGYNFTKTTTYKHRNTFIYNINTNYGLRLSKKANYTLKILLDQNALTNDFYRRLPFVNTESTIKSISTSDLRNTRMLNLSQSLIFSIKSKYSSSIFLNYDLRSHKNVFVSTFSNFGFINTNLDSLIPKSIYNQNISINYSIQNLKKFEFRAALGLYTFQNFISFNTNIIKLTYRGLNIDLFYRININKHISISNSLYYSSSNSGFIKLAGSNQITNLRLSNQLIYILKKNFFKVSFENAKNNINQKQTNTLISILNFEWNYNMDKTSIFIQGKNILNNNLYNITQLNNYSSTNFFVPMISRTILLGVYRTL